MRGQISKAPIAILSAELKGFSKDENENRTGRLWQALVKSGLPFAQVFGCYKGTQETSFKVNVRGEEEYDKRGLMEVLRLAEKFGQESILLVDEDRNASLVYVEGWKFERVGKLENVGASEPVGVDAWTFDPESGSYFVVR